jgi:diguanylate cyclase (GGDEF)-like protein/PAS domain S-box-containing protein
MSLRANWLRLIPLALLLLLLLYSFSQLENSWRETQEDRLNEVAVSTAQDIETTLLRAAQAAYILGSLVKLNNGQLPQFERHVDEIIESIPGISNLQLAPGGIIQRIHPLAGNEKAIGLNILRHDPSRNEAWIAMNTGTAVLTGPIKLIQGGLGVLVRHPVFVPEEADRPDAKKQFWGFASALILVDELLESTALSTLQARGFHYQLANASPHSGVPAIFAGSQNPLKDPVGLQVKVAVNIPNQSWTLNLSSTQATTHPPYRWPMLLSALLSVLLAGYLSFRPRRDVTATESPSIKPLPPAEVLDNITSEQYQLETAYLDHVNAIVLMLDANADITLCNRYGYMITGYPSGKLQGLNWIDTCVPKEEQAATRRSIEHQLQSPSAEYSHHESHILTLQGERRLIAWQHIPYCNVRDRHTYLFCTGQDITEHRKAQAHLIQLSSAVEQSSACVVIFNRQGIIEYVNPYFCRLTGYDSQHVIGRKPNFLEAPETDSASLIALRRQISRGRDWQGEIAYRKRNGAIFWARESISPISNNQGNITHFVSVSEDVTEQKENRKQIEKLAYYDLLTGLENRRLFQRHLLEATETARKTGSHLTLLYLDLDQFKRINDILGHDAGDQLIKKIAHKLSESIDPDHRLARLGGDEFAILAPDLDQEQASKLARQILDLVTQPIHLARGGARGEEMIVTGSLGIAEFPTHAKDASELLKHADMAMYRAKKAGRNSYQFFDRQLLNKAREELSLEREMRQAVENDEFVLYFQPQLDLVSGRVVGMEALIRWNHPTRGVIFPDQFIPLAEETGLIVPIGQQVIHKACQAHKQLLADGLSPMRIAINLSALQFRDPLFTVTFEQILREAQVQPHFIELELTESMLMDNIEDAITIMSSLKAMGCTLAIDDFGTGYSSLSYLKRLPVDILKVDRSFVKDIPGDENDVEITAAIIAMAHKLKLQVVAEGVETTDQEQFLMQNHCELVQGYLYSPPVPYDELGKLIRKFNPHEQGGKYADKYGDKVVELDAHPHELALLQHSIPSKVPTNH